MKNEKKVCVDCGEEFEITEGWVKLMEQNSNIKPPTRCYQCRQKRKQEKRENNKIHW